jgi:hypothetical protein
VVAQQGTGFRASHGPICFPLPYPVFSLVLVFPHFFVFQSLPAPSPTCPRVSSLAGHATLLPGFGNPKPAVVFSKTGVEWHPHSAPGFAHFSAGLTYVGSALLGKKDVAERPGQGRVPHFMKSKSTEPWMGDFPA